MADAITTKNITSVDEVQSVDNTDKVFVNDNGSFKQISVSNLMKQAPSGVTEETDPTVSEWAKQPTKPSYTANEVGALPVGTKIPAKTSDLTNDSGYLTQIPEEYVTETELGQKGYITEDDIPEKLPSPGTLTFTGAVNDVYDGSADKTINIPTGGGGSGTPGKDGREIEIQNNGTAIQWRYVGDESWTDLVQLSDITGAKGDPGENGITPTIQIGTVQTLEPGQQATASMSGTAENPLLNLGIPKGEKGDSDGSTGENKVLSDSSEWIIGNFIYENAQSVTFSVLQNRISTKYINEIKTSQIKVECNSGYKYRVLFFTEIKSVNNGSPHNIVTGGYDDYSTWHKNNRTLVVPEEARGYAVCMSKIDDTNIDTSECENISIYEIGGNSDNIENIFQNIVEQYNGKILSILGDSISTYSGHIPSGNRSRYPEGDVDSVDKTYWKKIIDTLGMKLGINESWAGSMVSWDGTTESNDIGKNKYIASTTRISHLGDNGTPDIILIFAGTNDIGHDVEIGSYGAPDFEQDISLLPVSTFSDAYMTMIMRVQYYYPESKILVLTPSFAKYTSYTGYTLDRLNQYINKIIEVCEIMGVDIIDTRKIGFSMYNIDDLTIDGLHPNAKGMELIYHIVLKKMLFGF